MNDWRMDDSFGRLFEAVKAARRADPAQSRTARLFADGSRKIAKKLIEEAGEVAVEAVGHDRDGVVMESADLLYQLCVVWAQAGVTPADVAGEIARREALLGIAEKLPKRLRKDEAAQFPGSPRRRAAV